MSVDSLEFQLRKAVQHQQAGRVSQAREICQQIVAAHPDHPDALHMLGTLALQARQNDEAVDWISRAVSIQPGNAIAQNNLGNALRAAGRADDAIDCFSRAVELKPDFFAARINLGNALRDKGRLDDSIEHLRRATQLQPGVAAGRYHLANALIDSGKINEAIECLRRALSLKPDYAEAHCALGAALITQGKLDAALESCRRAVQLKPDYATGHFVLGNAHKEKKQLDQAIACYRRALAIKPDIAEVLINLGSALFDSDHVEESVDAYSKALAIQPNHPQALFNMGNAMQKQKRYEAAVASYRKALERAPNQAEIHNNLADAIMGFDPLAAEQSMACLLRAIELKPDFFEALSNLGKLLVSQGRPRESLSYYQSALRVKPDCAETHTTLGMLLLQRGDWENGWREYEWRCAKRDEFARMREFSQPRWMGENLSGRTLLIYAEQGLGDTLQFCRYLDLAARRGGRVIFECQPALVDLLRRSIPACSIVARDGTLPPFDLHCPLLSLPMVLGVKLDEMNGHVPYLQTDAQLSSHWKNRLAADQDRIKVGLVWAGNKNNPNDHNRSIALSMLSPLMGATRAKFYSLQKGEAAAQAKVQSLEMQVIDWTDEIGNFDHTAALIENLDLIISVDTSVAHLAGALGKPVWILVPTVSDWRWQLDRIDCPWYPTMRLFRQNPGEGWNNVIPRIVDSLMMHCDLGRTS